MTVETPTAAETTSSRAAIIHGYRATPDDHWFGWLAERLRGEGVAVDVPVLPNTDAPQPEEWAATLSAVIRVPDEQTTVVAHSLGCLAVLRHLGSLPGPWRLGRLVLMAGFIDPLPVLPELDDFIGADGFIGGGVSLSGIAEHVGELTIVRSDDDPLVPSPLTDRLADLLGVRAQVLPGAGHFLADDGVTALPAVWRALRTGLTPAN